MEQVRNFRVHQYFIHVQQVYYCSSAEWLFCSLQPTLLLQRFQAMTRPLCTLPRCRPCLLTQHLHSRLKPNDRLTAVSGLTDGCRLARSTSKLLNPPFLPLQRCLTIGSVTQIPWRRASASPAAWTGPTSTSPDIPVSCVRVWNRIFAISKNSNWIHLSPCFPSAELLENMRQAELCDWALDPALFTSLCDSLNRFFTQRGMINSASNSPLAAGAPYSLQAPQYPSNAPPTLASLTHPSPLPYSPLAQPPRRPLQMQGLQRPQLAQPGESSTFCASLSSFWLFLCTETIVLCRSWDASAAHDATAAYSIKEPAQQQRGVPGRLWLGLPG